VRDEVLLRLVVTDLDGTLLDEETYGFAAARPALAALRARGVPLVLCSSKTRAEMERVAAALETRSPLIVENGGAIVVPVGSPAVLPAGSRHEDGVAVIPLGASRADLVAALPAIAREAGVGVRSFASMTAAEVSSLTGLGEREAALALVREWDEPFALEKRPGGESPDERLDHAARCRGLRVTRGGRLHHLTGGVDKGNAVRKLLDLLAPESGFVLGLGDAANDLSMLQAVDRPILVPRRDGRVDPALAAALPEAERAPEPGPAGWNAAVLAVLEGRAVVPVTP
jgi:mannosyl-3-phosphoglycerate phosphatase family protein